ncbi:3-oxoacyl-ACP reductase FabG [Thermostaphylospora chromogena]|uniref:3-oxoacyl-[acyl-carrier protein] reductase n=1 Tax=Thermostaphylospora chromogena TaxID=35622 RepID=A0A1H1CC46_9ACTN|nr:3-oxoacyl-ACP reductase FabG [Thermostaphylospora chromogena]SDQ61236.1 3-oxoacyl-[acyl-carrier protein] reductase [Thermostaphylospora chromogena]
MNLLEGRAAVVTGSARGIGLAIATVLARNGASVVVSDIDAEGAAKAAADLEAQGLRALAVPCDVTDEAAVDALVDACRTTFGSVDVMVNNAGITRDRTMAKMTLEDFKTVVDVHLTGAWLGTRAAGRVMRDQERGSIVNISSISGKAGNFGQTNYSAAKAGIVGLTKAAARELAKYKVRVNAVQPGPIRTAMTAAMPPEALTRMVESIPLGRIGEPEDVANAVLFLASDLSAFITGIVLEVAGGRHM